MTRDRAAKWLAVMLRDTRQVRQPDDELEQVLEYLLDLTSIAAEPDAIAKERNLLRYKLDRCMNPRPRCLRCFTNEARYVPVSGSQRGPTLCAVCDLLHNDGNGVRA